MADLTPFLEQLNAGFASLAERGIGIDPREGFRAELVAAGFEPPHHIELGRIQRIKAPDDKGTKKSGWCILHEIPMQADEAQAIGVGTYGSWRGGAEKITWSSKQSHYLSESERAHYNAVLEATRIYREQELAKVQEEAAQRAQAMWGASPHANTDHPYLSRKGIAALALQVRQQGERLLVPMCAASGIIGMQYIASDGEKRFMTGSRAKGAFFVIAGDKSTILLCEGFATGASLHLATGFTVYCAFSAGNLYEVAIHIKQAHPDARLIVAGDDDAASPVNTGRTKAAQVAEACAAEVAFPTSGGGKDFNDMHASFGLDAVGELFRTVQKIYKKKPKKQDDYLRPDGMLGQIYDYYNATAGNEQRGFAIQTAIAIGSITCARYYRTQFNNYASLYLMNIAKSGTGKEHCKYVVEAVLEAAGLDSLISGTGYTSSAGVISALQDRPRHITIIDEFSKYMATANNKNSNGNMAAAMSEIMQAFSKLDGKMRPTNYANTGIAQDKRKGLVAPVHRPAITLVGMTTPDDFFANIGIEQVKDGFLNRFLVSISDAERSMRKYNEPIEVPHAISEWAKNIQLRHTIKRDDFSSAPEVQTLNFTDEAMRALESMEQYKIDLANRVEKFRMDALAIRTAEIAARLSLLHALGRDAGAEYIDKHDVEWACAYVKACVEKLIDRAKSCMAGSEFEAWKMECLAAIREAGENGVSEREMHKTKPFSKYRDRDRKEILAALMNAELIFNDVRKTGGKGRPVNAYFAHE